MTHQLERIEMTNMCMIYDKSTGKVLVQERRKNDWNGLSFPGGHIEPGESIVSSVIREIKEETGLTVTDLKQCGIKDWYDFEQEKRYLVFFYKTCSFTGKLLDSSNEGKNAWMNIKEIYSNSNVADNFKEMLDIFLNKDNHTELFWADTKNPNPEKRWIKKIN